MIVCLTTSITIIWGDTVVGQNQWILPNFWRVRFLDSRFIKLSSNFVRSFAASSCYLVLKKFYFDSGAWPLKLVKDFLSNNRRVRQRWKDIFSIQNAKTHTPYFWYPIFVWNWSGSVEAIFFYFLCFR